MNLVLDITLKMAPVLDLHFRESEMLLMRLHSTLKTQAPEDSYYVFMPLPNPAVFILQEA